MKKLNIQPNYVCTYMVKGKVFGIIDFNCQFRIDENSQFMLTCFYYKKNNFKKLSNEEQDFLKRIEFEGSQRLDFTKEILSIYKNNLFVGIDEEFEMEE
jgi:acid phosphatase class B